MSKAVKIEGREGRKKNGQKRKDQKQNLDSGNLITEISALKLINFVYKIASYHDILVINLSRYRFFSR
jgi:hypothetical protein